jgi:hypothetical protein
MSKRVRHFNKQNEIHGYAKNKKMNDDVYALRRQVIGVIYEAKAKLSNLGVDLPRIDVRVTDVDHKALGWAYIGLNMVYIPEQLFTTRKKYFLEVVLHEIVHAVTGFKHDDNCPLMSPSVKAKPMDEAEAWKHFLKYFKTQA